MSQPTKVPFLYWSYFQAMLLYNVRAKAVAAQKRRKAVERRMVIEKVIE